METETMGTITVIVVVMGFKVWCTVYSDKENAVSHVNSFRSELSNNLKKYQYNLEDFKTARKKINIQNQSSCLICTCSPCMSCLRVKNNQSVFNTFNHCIIF